MITSAAVRGTVNGIYGIWPVHRHGHFFVWMKQLHCAYDKNEIEQGFLDKINIDYERFVDREEAARIAYECGQIKEPKNELFSEDLY